VITLTTYKWVPDVAVPLMRALRVRWALEEAAIPYQVRTVTLGAEQKSPEHLARQPFGQAPAIEEDGLTLFESGAIALYIAERSETLLPRDPIGRARAIGWLFAALNSVEIAVQQLASIDLFHAQEAWTKERRPQVEAFVRDRLALLESALGGKDYLEGRGGRSDDGRRAAHPAAHRIARCVSGAEGIQGSL
jgi:glutathione S-transferase